EHLLNVAELARSFAALFGAEQWGYRGGMLHDAGKATADFIRRLEGKSVQVDHSSFGACLAQERAGRLGLLLSYAIAGHHGGLPDGGEQETELHFRLKNGRDPAEVQLLPEVDFREELVPPFRLDPGTAGFSLAFFTRMVFSCLVDADFLDTEAFCNPEKAGCRPSLASEGCFADLKSSLDRHLEAKTAQAQQTPLNRLRGGILAQCREKAHQPPGFFSLTVPTGGGKTLSSLAFALNHVAAHGLRRVIYAIPFTSIIEQNARVFREALGREHVLEHHCNYRESGDPEDRAYDRRRGLAAENWDAPVVVTTNVQFFESLFSNKPSRCRKLHNIAGKKKREKGDVIDKHALH
ncbi:MAG: CRISPR-associated endonuclease Cas3'', partial [Desulfobacteraceae bacterium]|nr:CRISPR-associated endonuclease Cas3'' [Desulfobacteraceae bacterium]